MFFKSLLILIFKFFESLLISLMLIILLFFLFIISILSKEINLFPFKGIDIFF